MTTNEAAVCDLLALILMLSFFAGLFLMIVTNLIIAISAMRERKKNGLVKGRGGISYITASECGCGRRNENN